MTTSYMMNGIAYESMDEALESWSHLPEDARLWTVSKAVDWGTGATGTKADVAAFLARLSARALGFMADEYERMAEMGGTQGSEDFGIMVRDGRDCTVYLMDDAVRDIVLAEDRSWDDVTYDLGHGLRIHVHEWEGAEAEDWEPDASGYVPSGYVYASLDEQNEDGTWTEDVDGAAVGYGPDTTLGEWLDETFSKR